MNKLKVLITVILFTVLSCNNQENKTKGDDIKQQEDPKQEINKLNDFLKKFDEPSQLFKAATDKPIKVTGNQGTVIHLNPADLATESGKPLGKEVEIELKELTNQQQLLRDNAQTISDGQLLVSGGAYYINVTSDGENVKLKNGLTYSVEFMKYAKEEMIVYDGTRYPSGAMNWKETNQKFKSNEPIASLDTIKTSEAIIASGKRYKDTSILKGVAKNISDEELKKIKEDEKIKERLYSIVELNKFGYINCDRLYNSESKKTDIYVTITNKAEDVNYVKLVMLFKDIKSQIQTYYYVEDNKINNNKFNGIPVGTSMNFFAVCYQNGKLFAVLTEDMQIKENLDVKLTLKEMNENEFNNLLKYLN